MAYAALRIAPAKPRRIFIGMQTLLLGLPALTRLLGAGDVTTALNALDPWIVLYSLHYSAAGGTVDIGISTAVCVVVGLLAGAGATFLRRDA